MRVKSLSWWRWCFVHFWNVLFFLGRRGINLGDLKWRAGGQTEPLRQDIFQKDKA